MKNKQEPQADTSKKEVKYPAEVLEIHHAFETAGEALLAEAKGILKQCDTQSINKGKRLLNLGFKQAKEAVNAMPYLGKGETAQSVFDLVMHYQMRYPNNKFITEKQVEAICKKWKLECAPIDRFKGFVPEKNLRDIEGFKFVGGDKRPSLVKVLSAWNVTGFNFFLLPFSGAFSIHRNLGLKLIPADHPKLYWQRDRLFGVYNEDGTMGYVEWFKEYNFDNLMICAPKKDMDLKGLNKVGAVFQLGQIKHVPDPVVLQPVKGGYLIVTAWGDEASDENVVNEKMN